MKENVPGRSPRSKAVVFMLLSALSFAIMSVAVKAAAEISVFQKVFFRNFVILFLITGLILGCKNRGDLRILFIGHRGSRRWLLIRSIAGVLGVIGFFFCISRLSLGDAAMINKLSPFFVTIFAAFFLKEKITPFQAAALILAFTGALFIIKPRFDLSILPALAGFAAAVSAGAAYTIISYLKGKEDPDTVIFWFSLFSCLVMAVPTVLTWKAPDTEEWLSLLSVGIFSAGGQFFLTRAYHFAPAGEISIYNYTNILFSLILGLVFFGELPDGWSLLGGGMIVLVALGVFLRKKS